MNSVQTLPVAPDDADLRLDRWFKRYFPQVPNAMLQKWLRTGQVRVDGKRAKADTHIEAGQQIRIPPLPTGKAPPVVAWKPVSDADRAFLKSIILHQDESVIVLNKPAGLAVQGGTGTSRHLDGLLDALAHKGERPRLVHRLDRDTSGVLVLARTAQAAARLAQVFRSRDVHKLYLGVTVGTPEPAEGKINVPLAKQAGPKGERMAESDEESHRALTLYRVLDHAGNRAALVALTPVTGRTHQLRVHMAHIGCPILGDGKYGAKNAFIEGAEVPRQLHLHARRIVLPNPSGGTLDVSAPLPDHFRQTMNFFGFEAPKNIKPLEED